MSEPDEQFQLYEQTPDMTDSDMLEVIREKMYTGWIAVEYKYDCGIKYWTFERQ